MKRIIQVAVCVIVLILIIGIGFFKIENQRSTNIEGINFESLEDSNNVTKENIKDIDKCCVFVEKYFNHTITNDRKELIDIVKTINNVEKNDVFYRGFSSSKFQNEMKKDEGYKTGVLSENYLKTRYYSDVIIIKLKALLALGEYDEYKKCFIDNYNVLLIVGDSPTMKYNQDTRIVADENAAQAIVEAYDEILSMKLSDYDKFYVATDACFVYKLGDLGASKSKEYVEIRNNCKVDESSIFTGFESTLLNPDSVQECVSEKKVIKFRFNYLLLVCSMTYGVISQE